MKWQKEVNVRVTAMGRETQVKKLCRFPIFKEFNETDVICEFLECNFNKNFDGLIGNNILTKINAIIDYPNRTIKTNKAIINFYLTKEEEIYSRKSYKENEVEIFNNVIKHKCVTEFADTNHLNGIDKNRLTNILKRYKSVFYNDNDNLTFTSSTKHRIITKNDIPVYSKIYRYPEIHKPEIEKQIDQMLTQGIIRTSSSPYNSPIWLVPKKLDATNEQKWRL